MSDIANLPDGAGMPGACMPEVVRLTSLDPCYPSRLRALRNAPATLTVRGGPIEAARAVAVVGSRRATPDALDFARELAARLAQAQVVVVSGGAAGVDAAAHRGALEQGGRTWVVAGTGHRHCYPPEHADLFEKVARGPGAMIWPFDTDEDGAPVPRLRAAFFRGRNRILVALAAAVVVVQAAASSGAIHAAGCARNAAKPLWVVPAPPWLAGFEGSRELLAQGARPLTSVAALLEFLGIGAQTGGGRAEHNVEMGASMPRSPSELAVLGVLLSAPLHLDTIAAQARQPAQVAAAALLTLVLENVVVEGPPGFFRRRDAA